MRETGEPTRRVLKALASASMRPDTRELRSPTTTTTAELQSARQLAGGIDALVRMAVTHPAQVDELAKRVLANWSESPSLLLTVTPDALWWRETALLRADDKKGRWLLPIFMAGVYEVGLSAEGNSHTGLVSFANEVAALRVSTEALHQFANWLWGEGAEGMVLAVGVGILEVDSLRERTDKSSQTDQVRAVRGAGLVGDNIVTLTSDDLDRAAIREELQVPLTLYQDGARAAAFRLDDDERRQWAKDIDDLSGWVELELAAAMVGPPALVDRLPTSRLVRVVRDRLASAAHDSEAVERIVRTTLTLRQSRPDVWEALIATDLANLLGTVLALNADCLPVLIREHDMIPSLARALLLRAESPAQREALGELGAETLARSASVTTDDGADGARRIGTLIDIASTTSSSMIPRLIRSLPQQRWAEALHTAPATAAAGLTDVLDALLKARVIDIGLVIFLERSADVSRTAIFAMRVRQSRGRCLAPGAVSVACRYLARDVDTAVTMAGVANHPFTDRHIKLAMLRALSGAPQAAKQRATGTIFRYLDDEDVFAARKQLGRETNTPKS